MQRTLQKLHKSPGHPLRILSAGSYQAAKGIDFRPHSHSHWELAYYRSGTVECLMNDQRHPGYAGLVWLTPPEVTHAERAVTAYANHFIAFDLKSETGWPAFLDDDADRSLGRVCQQIVIECGRKTKGQATMLELLGAQLVCLINRVQSEKILPPAAQAVAKAERFIEERCGEPLTIRDVAQAIHVSSSTLRSYFQAVRGFSPRDHLAQVRVARAINFLRTSTLKLEAIAALCGYDSASHLTRGVKKFTRRTPGQVRAG
jgi:AraC-like DNA-binding protein